MVESFKLVAGRDLVIPSFSSTQSESSLGKQLFDAPFVVVSHNGGPDPKLNYDIQVALDLWEMGWWYYKGFIDGYEGIRISSTGRRFKINSAIIGAVPAIGTDGES